MIHALFDIDETLLSVPKGINAKTSGVMLKKVSRGGLFGPPLRWISIATSGINSINC